MEKGRYATELFTARAQAWIERTVAQHASEETAAAAAAASASAVAPLRTFAYVAHEAVHGPLEAPQRLYDGPCAELVGEEWPIRRTYCAMVRSLDEGIANLTATYKALGLWNSTLVVVSTDNGGQPLDGGNNFPLRGCKATTFEGGVRGLGFISGAGLAASVRGSISHQLIHVVDWGPTIIAGIAGLPLAPLGRPCATCSLPTSLFSEKRRFLSASGGM